MNEASCERVLMNEPLIVVRNEMAERTIVKIHPRGWALLVVLLIFCSPFFAAPFLALHLLVTAEAPADWAIIVLFAAVFLFPSLFGIKLFVAHITDAINGRSIVLDDARDCLTLKRFGKTKRIPYSEILSIQSRISPYKCSFVGELLIQTSCSKNSVSIFRTLGVSGPTEDSIQGSLRPLMDLLSNHCMAPQVKSSQPVRFSSYFWGD